jgi:antitoxin MazE
MEGERIVISPPQPRYALDEQLRGMTPAAMHEAFDWGPERGRETVDE